MMILKSDFLKKLGLTSHEKSRFSAGNISLCLISVLSFTVVFP